jgi:hypothetical protein
MKERGILFSAPMVRALLDGTKTQTRRALRVQPLDVLPMEGEKAGREWVGLMELEPKPAGTVFCCKFGQPGDRLWVRETWAFERNAIGSEREQDGPFVYRATDSEQHRRCDRWRPGIHMPRWASRILLEIVSVRVERLQDISEADAEAEGCERLDTERYERDPALCPKCDGLRLHRALGPGGGVIEDVDCTVCDTYLKRYRHLWESINGFGSWAANPWVWVVEFRRIER